MVPRPGHPQPAGVEVSGCELLPTPGRRTDRTVAPPRLGQCKAARAYPVAAAAGHFPRRGRLRAVRLPRCTLGRGRLTHLRELPDSASAPRGELAEMGNSMDCVRRSAVGGGAGAVLDHVDAVTAAQAAETFRPIA